MKKTEKAIVNNTAMLYILTIAKMIFPLITLPYLTRVLEPATFGVFSYVKSVMSYMQVIIDFGFLLSAVKDITKAVGDRDKINRIIGNTYFAKTLLIGVAFVAMLVMTAAIPILRENWLYTLLAFIAVAASAYLADFLFRGIEKMGFVTIVFVVMKGLSTVLTVIFVKGEEDLLLIPLFDLASTLIADVASWLLFVKMGYKPVFSGIKEAIGALKESWVYFASNMATTAFGALNSLIIGIAFGESDWGKAQIGYWGVCMQLVAAVQSLYNPLINGIFPAMVREKKKSLLLKMTYIFMPIVVAGCVFCWFAADWIIAIVADEGYEAAANVFRALVPVLFLSYPAMLYGWPALGAIGRKRETTLTTIVTAVVQCIGLVVLALCGRFTLIGVALLRGFTELILLLSRLFYCVKYRKEFR